MFVEGQICSTDIAVSLEIRTGVVSATLGFKMFSFALKGARKRFSATGSIAIPVSASILLLLAGCGGSSGGSSSRDGGGGGGTSTIVTFSFEGPAPTAVAAKIGSAAYTAQSIRAGQVTLAIPSKSPDFSLAYICPPWPIVVDGRQEGRLIEQSVLQQNIADGTSFTWSCTQTPTVPQTGKLTGSVDASAIPGASLLSIQAANGSSAASVELPGPVSSFSLDAPVGSDRVAVLAFDSSSSLLSNLLAAKTYDNQTVPGAMNEGNPAVFGAADKTVAQAITYQNVPSGFAPPTVLVTFFMGTSALLNVAPAARDTYPALPTGAVRSGDAYSFLATAYQNPGGVGWGPQLLVSATSKTGGPMTFSFPAPWTYGGPVAAALPTIEYSYAGFPNSNTTYRGASIGWSDETKPDVFTFSMSTSGRFANGATQVTFPNLSTIPGFLPAPASGTVVSWLADVADVSPQGAPSGTRWVSVRNIGIFTVP